MPNWKKLLTSGSNIQISELTLAVEGVTKASIDTSGNISVAGTVDGRDLATDGTKLDGIASSANNYVLPTNLAGDDIDIDTGALTGATVISDLDFNVTTNSSGLVTDANGTVATRTLTLANLGYTGTTDANTYVLPTNLAGDDIDIDTGALTGATVISDLDINITTNTSGLVTDANASVATRTLTAANLSLGNVTNESKATMFTSPTFTGTVTTPLSKIGWRNLDWQGNIAGNSPAYAQGDVIYHGSSIVTVAGGIYHMQSNGNLALADADAVSTSSTLLVVALSTNANLGLLLRGTVVLKTSPGASPGAPIYLSTTAGNAQAAAPSGTGDVVRVLGYQLTPNGEGDQVNVCYFNPDNTWVELT